MIVGRPFDKGPFHGGGGWLSISPSYFDVFKIPVLRGRAFTDQDDAAGARLMIISQKLAQQYWPKQDPLGQQIWIGKGFTMAELAAETPRKIVGITGDVRGALDRDPQPNMHVPNAQVPERVQRARCPDLSDGVGGAHARQANGDERHDSGAVAPRSRTASERHSHHG